MKTPDFCLNDSALTRDKKIVLHFLPVTLKHNGFACINYFYKCLGDVSTSLDSYVWIFCIMIFNQDSKYE